jgi:hypothetical protein
MIMEQAHPIPFRPSLSIRQMMKLVVFGAIASACLAPGYHLIELGVAPWPGILIMESVVVPLVLALAAFPLVRKGSLKDWFIRAALLVSVTVAIVFGIYLTIFFFAGLSGRQGRPDVTFLTIDVLVIAVLGLFLVELVRGLVPRRCSDCSRLTMIRDAKATVSPGDVRGKSYLCLCCQGQFHQQ